jgi:hypothetical protein
MPRAKNTDIGKTYTNKNGKVYTYNGRLHEKISYQEWLSLMKEGDAHGMDKAKYIKYKLGIPLRPNRFSHEDLQGNNGHQ